MKVYLAGRIDTVDKNRALQWREYATKLLENFGFEVINPYKIDQGSSDKQIFDIALKRVEECDCILVDVTHLPNENTGTAAELMYAYLNNKIVIGWQEIPSSKRRIFINILVPTIYNTLDEAIEHVFRL